jgi:hypothetical protein
MVVRTPCSSSAVSAAAAVGRAKRYPWPYSQPSARSCDKLLGLLDALGHHVEAEAVGERHGGADDDLAAGPLGQRGDEAAVHLERPHRELVQRRQGGVPGTEAVELEAQPGVAEIADQRPQPLRVPHQGALGDLQAQHRTREVDVGEGPEHVVGETGVVELAGGHVDAHKDVAVHESRLPPVAQLGQRRSQDGPAHLAVEAGLLGDGDELGR